MKIHFNRIFFLGLASLALFFTFSCKNLLKEPEKEILPAFIPGTNPQIQITGRYYVNDDVVEFAHAGTQINLRFDGSVFTLIMANQSPEKGIYNGNFLNVYMDGGPPVVVELKNTDTFYDLSEYLVPGDFHNVRIVKRTEAACGLCRLFGFYLEDGHHFVTPVQEKERKIEFIGNSLTCGFGVETDKPEDNFKPATENVELSFAGVASQILNADYTAIAFSGIGISRNVDTNWHSTYFEMYQRIFPQHGRRWDFSRWIPQAIVINLGTNDFSQGIPDSNSFIDAYLQLLDFVHSRYPQGKIFCLTGPMLSNSWPIDESTGKPLPSLDICQSYIKSAIYRFKAAGYKEVYFFAMKTSGDYGYGAAWHPSKKQHQINGEELAEFMKPVMGW